MVLIAAIVPLREQDRAVLNRQAGNIVALQGVAVHRKVHGEHHPLRIGQHESGRLPERSNRTEQEGHARPDE